MSLPLAIDDQLRRLVPGAGGVLLAVSGGADSVALACLLAAAGRQFTIATLNHGIRPEAEADVEFVVSLGQKLDREVVTAAFDVPAVAAERGWNLEEAARRLRYQQLGMIARRVNADCIVTAHTRDDQTETVLMQLLRGAAWLTGMPAVRGRVVRPLLETDKAELTAWLQENGQDWREDASNQDVTFERAWLRSSVLPALRARHPDLDERISNLARHQQLQKDYVSRQAERYIGTGGQLDTARLREPALRNQAVARILGQARAPVDTSRLARIDRHIQSGGNYRETLDPGSTLRLVNGLLDIISSGKEELVPALSVSSAEELPPGSPVAALDYPDLLLRCRQPGDRITLGGGTRKVSDVLIDAKIPREDRDRIRLLASGSQVLWIEGLATSTEISDGNAPSGDRHFMQRALAMAAEAAGQGELPVGAVIVKNGVIIASAHNATEASGDPTAHAELLAIRRAAEATGDWRLQDCTLYVTLEPCAMCFGAVLQAHLPEVVYAASNRREGATGGVADLDLLDWKRKVKVRRGPLGQEAAALLTAFFAERR